MLWLFERDEESLKLETRYDNDRSEFMAFIRYPDGHEHTERFSDAEAFRSWLVAFEGDLETQRWTLHGSGPVFLPHGWPDIRLIAGRCPICSKPVKIERARRPTSAGFVAVGGPMVRRVTCEDGHVSWPDDLEPPPTAGG
jgi:hypothetical protein